MIIIIRYFSGSESKCCTFSRGCNFKFSPQNLSNSRSFAWNRKAHSLLRITAAIPGGAACPSMEEKRRAFKIETWLNYETPRSSRPLVTSPAGAAARGELLWGQWQIPALLLEHFAGWKGSLQEREGEGPPGHKVWRQAICPGWTQR